MIQLWTFETMSMWKAALEVEIPKIKETSPEKVIEDIMSGKHICAEEWFDSRWRIPNLYTPLIMAYSPSLFPNPEDWPKENIIVTGHMRMSAARQLEYSKGG